jgi:hypothetical protein
MGLELRAIGTLAGFFRRPALGDLWISGYYDSISADFRISRLRGSPGQAEPETGPGAHQSPTPQGLCYFFSPCSRATYVPVWVIDSRYGLSQLFRNIFERVPASFGLMQTIPRFRVL